MRARQRQWAEEGGILVCADVPASMTEAKVCREEPVGRSRAKPYEKA